ncbi:MULTISPECIES: glycosyltransferase family protein [Bombella]|uniref:Glycosyl transferase n=1 Tax=Bombella pollinis TaxID=2967337 RepID=A0ABT3WQQ3_9PROT|nr:MULTISPECIES: glycosyl transferase [Bombella]MCX5620042.1 glycosyl transferase [Bombella pollinis]MUG05232.1 glycosyl transferase [Bombella sp. ESL0378]MUG90779.1 glycosyl transferase [Bombella sp. ESL0385]
MTTPPRRLIITGSDHRYFPLLQELVASLRRFPHLATIEIACIDGGLKRTQIHWLKQQHILHRAPRHFPHVSPRALRKRPHLAIELSKMALDQLFPDYDTLLWLDADSWVQDCSAIDLLLRAAEQKGQPLAIIPELFLHKPLFRLRWLAFSLTQLRSILYKNARIARLPRHLCRAIGVRPTLNGGVFALSRTAPHWPRLRYWQERVLRYGKIFSSSQLAFALTSYHDNYPIAFMPTGCNYLGPWMLHPQTSQLCEVTFPHNPVGIVHLAGYDAMRLDPKVTLTIPDLNGTSHALNLRFPFIQIQQEQSGNLNA